MKNIRRIASVLSAAAIASCMSVMSIAAFAEQESDMIAKDEIIEYVWNDLYDWDGGDDGTIYAEGSFKHYMLTNWVDEYYGKDVHAVSDYYGKDNELDVDYYQWSDLERIYDNYREYLSVVWEDYSDHDDDNGNYYISEYDSSDVLYRFELINGTWNMIDTNGNTVAAFPIFSTLEETEDESSSDVDTLDEDGDDGEARVTGEVSYETSKTQTASAASVNTPTSGKSVTLSAPQTESYSETTESISEEDTESSPIPYVLGGCAVFAAGAVVGIAVGKKKK